MNGAWTLTITHAETPSGLLQLSEILKELLEPLPLVESAEVFTSGLARKYSAPADSWFAVRATHDVVELHFARGALAASGEYTDFANDLLSELFSQLDELLAMNGSVAVLQIQIDHDEANTHTVRLPFGGALRVPVVASFTATASEGHELDQDTGETTGLQHSFDDHDFLTIGLSGQEPVDPEAAAEVTRVFFATDRQPTGFKKPTKYYGSERGPLRFGWCDVTIPPTHVIGRVESPRWWRLEFSSNPNHHVVLQGITEGTEQEFVQAIRETTSSKPRILAFCHGYNVKFADAARRVAQMCRDMKFDGVPVLYSWPSKGHCKAYLPDSAAVESSTQNLFTFLELLAVQAGAAEIHVLAHSMGTRAVTRALDKLSERRHSTSLPFRQVMLAAADIDAGELTGAISRVTAIARRLTLYGSASDHAIRIARTVFKAPRAGDGGTDLLVQSGLDSIDATNIDTSFLAHSYIADNPALLFDVATLIEEDKDPAKRKGIQKRVTLEGWEFIPRRYQ